MLSARLGGRAAFAEYPVCGGFSVINYRPLGTLLACKTGPMISGEFIGGGYGANLHHGLRGNCADFHSFAHALHDAGWIVICLDKRLISLRHKGAGPAVQCSRASRLLLP